MAATTSMTGLRVLVPRGGDIGTRLAEAVTARAGVPTVAPVIELVAPADPQAVADACTGLTDGRYDWVAVTSATTVDALVAHDVRLPAGTRVAVVGPGTRDAMRAAGFPVDFMPSAAYSAAAMVAEWPVSHGTVLLPQSALAEPTLADGLVKRGLTVTTVSAYDTTSLSWDQGIRRRLGTGEFHAVLLTAASVARAVAGQGVPLPDHTVVACIGDSTAVGARAAGLPVHVVASTSTAEGLVEAVSDYFSSRQPAPTRTEATP
jgi:uroporphyrinogen-III synthase